MIRALIETSMVDWDGKITMVLFFDRCNFMCPYCQNWELIRHPKRFPIIEWDEVIKKLNAKKGWIDGVVLTGGEPLIFKKEVFRIAENLRKLQLGIKLDTNGAYPEILQELIKEKLIDYVAMDVKAPLNSSYYIAAGKRVNLKKIEKSIEILLQNLVDYEFRTTCVPGIIDEDAICRIGERIRGAKRWALQQFVPDNAYKEEYRTKKNYKLSLQRLQIIAQQYVLNVILRVFIL